MGNDASAATAALCAATTTIAAAAACVSSMFTACILEYMATGEVQYDVTMAMNGCLGGLVAITAGCSVVTPWAALIIGIIGGWVYLGMSKLLIKLRIDDAVDAIPVHFANSELMTTAGYNDSPGLFYGSGNLIGVQILGI